MATQTGRILVIRGGALGDFLLTLPVLAALRGQFPQARLEVLGYRHFVELAIAGGLADDVRSIEARPLAGFFAQHGELSSEWQSYFQQFAVIISFLYDPEGVFEENVRKCSPGQFIAGPHRPDEREGVHATEVFLRPLQRLAIFDADPTPRLRVGPGPERRRADGSAGSSIALHPGSGSERKNWPEANWGRLLEQLAVCSERKLLLVGGEAEGERLQRLARRVPPERLECAFQRPLPELATRLAECSCLVGHDSGISHLAAALGLEVFALWGETSETIWRPRGPGVRIVRSPRGLASLAVEDVLRELGLAAPDAGQS
jgi:heptosyltransferase-2